MKAGSQCLWQWALRSATILLMGSALFDMSAYAQQRLVRVGIFENAPELHMDNGQPSGILGELLSAVANTEKWTLTPVACEWRDCLEALQEGRIDLMPDVPHSVDRSDLYDFHKVPSLHSWSQMYQHPDERITSVLDLQGKRIVSLAGSVQADYIASLAGSFGIRAQLIGVSDLQEGFAMVADNRADAAVANYYYGELHAAKRGLVATPLMFQPTQLFYATKKGRNIDLLDAIDRNLTEWQGDSESVYFRILQRWGQATPAASVPSSFWWVISSLGLLLVMALGLAALFKAQVNRQTRHLKASETRLNTILDSVDAHIYIKDRQLKYRYGNHQLCEFFGLHAPDLIDRRDDEFLSGTSLSQVRQNDLRVINNGERVALEEQVAKPGGQGVDTFFSIKIPLRDSRGKVEALCGISTNITDHKVTQAAAHRLAYYDPLTELPNRRLLLERMGHALEAVRCGAGIGAVLFVDLDNFKRINDARGHVLGDAVLCGVAQRLKDMVRGVDTVARIGGDEFVILLDHFGRTQEESARIAMTIAESVRAALEQPLIIDGQPYFSGGSIGVTLLRPDGKSTHDVLREADTAMYRAKESGRNRVAFYETSMQTEIEERLALEHDLSLAIGTEQLGMYAQPQYDRNGDIAGAELLIRWEHPTRGSISPSRFIPIAEETGVILRIGDWTLQQACSTLLRLEQAGQHYPLSINVSPRQFRQPDFVSRVREIVLESGAPVHRLIFEVTEGILIEDLQGAIDRMAELSDIGIRFSIDDFGTGYSNLTYLKRLPLYELKIDKSFIHDAPGDPDNTAIVKLILAMAKQLSLRVVAEGVETQAQADFLSALECDAMQGYLFARPIPIARWLDSSHTEPLAKTP
ncbi:EAL domain-containing protein [Pollutimonas sp. H1-120]|uniref:EAL domain-containing protein n=1 Tax=Pollutimonas sp. H1-120 TaxID=3148824 RepID=UPI003B522EDB